MEALRRLLGTAHRLPCFPVPAARIQILLDPRSFYDALVDRVSRASNRVLLSSLYLGTGSLERNLIKTLEARTREKNLRVNVLLDHTRGSRGRPNSMEMLKPLLSISRDAVAAFYHTPELRGLMRKALIPPFNEVVGLQHTKIYVMDDTVMLSGANLSNDYFTLRQDRCVVFQDKALADFFADMVQAISDHSFRLQPDGSMQSSPRRNSLEDSKDVYTTHLRDAILGLYERALQRKQTGSPSDDTWVYPVSQMGPFGVRQEEVVTRAFGEKSVVSLASGYFNLTSNYIDAILASKASYDILTAAPGANGFLGAKGIRGHIPAAYTYIEKKFLEQVRDAGRNDAIRVHEWQREGWTFHAKGIWMSPSADALPLLSMVGSSNFGFRSMHRDLEAQAIIVTNSADLGRRLRSERDHLFSTSVRTTLDNLAAPERHVKDWEKVATRVVHTFF